MADWQDPKIMRFWILGASLIILFLLVFVLFFIRNYVARIIKENQRQADFALQTQKELLRHTLFIQEEERSRIALDLHDNLISQLNIIRMLNENEEDRRVINHRLKNSMASARKISHDLTPPLMTELGLPGLMEEYLGSLNIGIELHFYCFHSLENSELPQVKLHVFRIFQEVITNCFKHANASVIEVHFRGTTSAMTVLIKDNGNGDGVTTGDGLGLKNIESRAQFLKARYRFHSSKGAGTRFLLFLNLKNLTVWEEQK
jgi:signal transduction histidine kinase